MRIQINISSANEVYNKKGTSLIASQRLTAKCWRGVLARYHTGIVKLGVAITSEPHLCTLELYAIRDIWMGEEICTSYLADLEIPTAERRKRLMPWLAGNCGCSRCVSEG